MSSNTAPTTRQAMQRETADWLVRWQSGDITDDDRQRFERWRTLSPEHAAAWARAESVLGIFGQVPAELGRHALTRLRKNPRRQILQALGLAATIIPTTWLGWHQASRAGWLADLRTRTGEQASLELADGTRLVLNTASAVDVGFTEHERRLTMHAGEILVTTGHAPGFKARPFVVASAHGRMRALGTRFSVRQLGDSTRLAVFEGAVEARPTDSAAAFVVRAGEQTDFTTREVQEPRPVDSTAALWAQGMWLAQDMPLGTLLAELARYRPGLLRCDPAVATMKISGAFPLGDTDASLRLLEKTRPLHIDRATPWWVTVRPRHPHFSSPG